MNERKKKILFSIINSYINIGEPIGSNALLNEYALNISSATIRNEMSTLEKMGLLEKAHSSSGRFPSDKGYRLYVDYILENNAFKENNNTINQNELEKILDKRYGNVSNVVETATLLLASITNLTAISVTLRNNINKILNIEILKLSSNCLLFISVYDNASIVNDRIYLKKDISSGDVEAINLRIKKEIEGKNINEIKPIFERLKKSELNEHKELLEILEKKIDNDFLNDLTTRVIIKGLGNIFNFKEFEDPLKAKEFIRIFDSEDKVRELLKDTNQKLKITIGDENEQNELKSNTLITSHFNYDEDIVGQIGIVGLTRINYEEVISDIKLISDLLSK